MNQFLLFASVCAALSVSCYSTKESCPTIYISSEITIHEHVMMYKHVVECCGVEKKLYGTHADMIQEWIKIHPTIMIYHTFWGSVELKYLHEIYFLHILGGLFILGLWAVIVEENRRMRR